MHELHEVNVEFIKSSTAFDLITISFRTTVTNMATAYFPDFGGFSKSPKTPRNGGTPGVGNGCADTFV